MPAKMLRAEKKLEGSSKELSGKKQRRNKEH